MEGNVDSRLVRLSYDARQFKDIGDTEFGQEVWNWLKLRDNVVRMETASYLGRPAVEALGPHLFDRFGQDIAADRNKQVVGHMVRQIMEAMDYEYVPQKKRITQGIFKMGSRYIKKSS